MRKTTAVLLFSSMFIVTPVMAGAGHEHGFGGTHSHGPITSEAAVKKATKQIQTLIERGKLEKSWGDVKATGAIQKTFAKGTEWVVTFKNDKVKDPAKQSLYVFYTVEGSYIASNHTGE
jgi:hypothetical protein